MHEKPIDVNSEYYRICPNCGKEFMANDLRDKYCCQKCHDDYNNRIKRFKRASEPLKNPTMPPEPAPTERQMVDLKYNIQTFTDYRIGRDGIIVPIQELYGKDVRFYAYTARFPAYKKSKGYLVEYGPFILSRETVDHLLIRAKTNFNERLS
jgi:ribosomal protein S27AE